MTIGRDGGACGGLTFDEEFPSIDNERICKSVGGEAYGDQVLQGGEGWASLKLLEKSDTFNVSLGVVGCV